MKKIYFFVILTVSIIFIFSCKKDDPEEVKSDPPVVDAPDPVQFDLAEVPYEHLSDYRFYLGNLKEMTPNSRVIPYDIINQLFSDYAHKQRFIWMPEGVKAVYESDGKILQYPNGTVFIKNFYYDNVLPNHTRRIVETRLIYRKDDAWHFADYVWNEEQTEAQFDTEVNIVPLTWEDELGVSKSVNFRIPSQEECFTCHKINSTSVPIGPKPQNLNKNFEYSNGSMNQLSRWVQEGMLESSYPENINTVPSWEDTSLPLLDRVRGYVDANCAHCHQDGSHCDYRPMRFAYSEFLSEENLGVCTPPEEFINTSLTHIISRGNTDRSVIHFRMNTNAEQYRMPLLGRTVIHEEGVALMTDYINSLSPPCQ
jgi:uncharacterized repeat protein (TIGR03806 family)